MSRYLLNPELPVVKPGFKGNHFADGRFKPGEGGTIDASYLKVLRWQLSSNPQKEEKKNDTFKLKAVRGRTCKNFKGAGAAGKDTGKAALSGCRGGI